MDKCGGIFIGLKKKSFAIAVALDVHPLTRPAVRRAPWVRQAAAMLLLGFLALLAVAVPTDAARQAVTGAQGIALSSTTGPERQHPMGKPEIHATQPPSSASMLGRADGRPAVHKTGMAPNNCR